MNKETREKTREAFKGAQGDFNAAREKIAALTKESHEKQLAVLTDEQKKKWNELLGEPFEVKFQPRRKSDT